MSVERTTVTVDKRILDAAKEKARKNNETLSDFLSRATLNQLEKEDANNSIRYEMRDTNEKF